MKLGYFAMPLHRPELLPADTYDQDLEAVCWADKLGYEEAWIGEHYILPYENMPSTDLFIAKALGVTEQIVMGTGVVLLQFHHPVHVAIRIAMLDHLARGRLCFGVGSAAGAHDFALFGLDADAIDPRERIKESIEVILKLWTEDEPFEYQGKYFQVKTPEPALEDAIRFHMKPYQKPHPPIALAGSTPASGSLQLAGQLGWIPMSSGFIHSHFLPTNWETIEKGAAMTGKNPSRSDWRIVREVYVGDNGQKAREEALNGPLGRFFVDYWANLIGKGPRGYGRLQVRPRAARRGHHTRVHGGAVLDRRRPRRGHPADQGPVREGGRVRHAPDHRPRLGKGPEEVAPVHGADGQRGHARAGGPDALTISLHSVRKARSS